MKINYTKGDKGNGDRIIKITTDNEEWFSIFKLSLLVNQLAINELNVHGDTIKRTGNFFFGNALKDSLEMAELGIDWGQEENKEKVKEWCKRWCLKFEPIESELRKVWQSKLEDFDNGST